jgi:hypothetical protein
MQVLGPKPFLLDSILHPIPYNLVQHIQLLEFVEMRELLPDKKALVEKLEALPSRPDQPAKQSVKWAPCSLGFPPLPHML